MENKTVEMVVKDLLLADNRKKTVEPIQYFVVSRDQQRCAEADRDPQNIWDPRKDCGSFVDEKLWVLYCRNLNK